MKLDLKAGEQALGHWTLFYIPPNGGKYNAERSPSPTNAFIMTRSSMRALSAF